MYATPNDVIARTGKTMSTDEKAVCQALLNDAAVIIDSYNERATAEARKIVSCRMVIRAMQTADVPVGANQGSMAALGYSASWTISGGTTGELYLSKLDKKLLGVGAKIGSHSPLEDLT